MTERAEWVIGKTICARSAVDEVWFTRILDKGGVIVGEASGSSREESLYRAHLFKAAEAMKDAIDALVQAVDEPMAATATLQAHAIDAALLKCRAALRLATPQEE